MGLYPTVLLMKGFSLIEVLIALFIFSFGLLGIVALVTTSLEHNYSAYLRSIAVTQLLNGYNRMRVGNKTQEILLWNKMNSELLPQGVGEYKNNKLKICWYSKVNGRTICLQSG